MPVVYKRVRQVSATAAAVRGEPVFVIVVVVVIVVIIVSVNRQHYEYGW